MKGYKYNCEYLNEIITQLIFERDSIASFTSTFNKLALYSNGFFNL